MDLLVFLWWSSLALSGLALAWMMFLIIARLFRDNSEARRTADRRELRAAFLSIMAGSGDAARLLAPFHDRSRLVAETLLDVLALVRGSERERLVERLSAAGVDARLRSRLSKGSRTGRLAALEALSAFPSQETRAALKRVLRETTDPDMRIAAVRTLMAIGEPPRPQDLLADMNMHTDRDSLLYAPVLQELAAQSPDDGLAALAIPKLPIGARAVMIDAVGASGEYRALPQLATLAGATEPVLRTAAVRALGRLGHPGAVNSIAAALADPAWEVRAEAALAAGRIGVGPLVPQLVDLLRDPVWWVRFHAAGSLVRMGEPGLGSLRAAAHSADDVVRRSASLALAESGLA